MPPCFNNRSLDLQMIGSKVVRCDAAAAGEAERRMIALLVTHSATVSRSLRRAARVSTGLAMHRPSR